MRVRNRSLAILLCLFLISFKAAAGSIFIDSAIERAQMHEVTCASVVLDQSHLNKEPTDRQEESHTLYLMSHVTGNISDAVIVVPALSSELIVLNSFTDTLFTQNFPDSAFKPPKVNA